MEIIFFSVYPDEALRLSKKYNDESFLKPNAKAIISEKGVDIKLLKKVPKGQYYSLLNDAGIAFEEQYPELCR